MRKVFALSLVLLALVACTPVQPTPQPDGDTIVNVNTNVNTGGNTPGNGASPSPGTCGPVTEVTNGLLGAGGVKNVQLRVGEFQTLDTTPNKNRDEHCNAFRRVSWRITQSTQVCTLNNPESYTPVVTAVSVGTCVIVASVENVSANEPITVTVR